MDGISPRALDYTETILSGPIPHEAELTAGVRVEPDDEYGFFTDSSLCIGCKACEVACKEWNALPVDNREMTGFSYDNTRAAFIDDLAARELHRAIIERWKREKQRRNGAISKWLADAQRCLQTLRKRGLRAGLPHRRAVSHRVWHRRRAARYLQRMRLLHPVLSVWRRGIEPARRSGTQMHALLRSAEGGLGAGVARSCPTNSIQFGRVSELQNRAERRLERLHELGVKEARLYGVPGAEANRRHRATECVFAAARPPGNVQLAGGPDVAEHAHQAGIHRRTADHGGGHDFGPIGIRSTMTHSMQDETMTIATKASDRAAASNGVWLAKADVTPLNAVEHVDPSSAYDGRSYYGQPAVKKSHYGWLIVSYFFVGGLGGSSRLLAAIADLRDPDRYKSIVRAGRYLGFLGAVASPIFLIADLHVPRRWFNMLRIFRSTSAMSIGAWTLFGFGVFSGLTFAGQLLSDLFHLRFGRWVARIFGLPAAIAGTIMSFYTGVLISSTSTPLWASAPRLLPALFGSSAASTAAAAIEFAGRGLGQSAEEHRRLTKFAFLTAGLELALATALRIRWRQKKLDAPLAELPLPGAFVAATALCAAAPLAIHAASLANRRVWRQRARRRRRCSR